MGRRPAGAERPAVPAARGWDRPTARATRAAARRQRRAAALAVAMAMALAACGTKGIKGINPTSGRRTRTTITFSISVTDQEKPAIQELLSRFQDRTKAKVDVELLSRFRNQPASRVELTTSLDAASLVKHLRQEVATGKHGIQLFAQDNLAMRDLVDQGLVQDLSGVEIPTAVLASMIPSRFGGRQFFLPFRPNVRLTYMDRRALEGAGLQPPRTVDELVAAARALKAGADGTPKVTLSLAQGDAAAVTLSELIVSYGGNPLVLNDDGSAKVFELLQQMWKQGLLARQSLFAKYDTEVGNLAGGTALLAQNWSFTSAELQRRGLLGGFEVYAGWSGPARAAHVIGGDVLGIPQGVTGQQKDVALALARFLMSKEAQEFLARKNAWPSIRNDAYGTVPREERQTFSAIQVALQDGWFRPSVAYWSDVTAEMNQAVTRIVLEDEPVRPVLDQLHARIAAAASGTGAEYPPPLAP